MLYFISLPLIHYLLTGLPVQVRDYALNLKDEVPRSEVNREYYSQNMEREVSIDRILYACCILFILKV